MHISVLILGAALACTAFCQEFEVASVRPAKPGVNGEHTRSDSGMLTATNLSLKSMIVTAYNVKDYQVDGPNWIGSQNFDIVAKFPEPLANDRDKYNAALGSMMQKMLAERFGLAIHREEKTLPVYGLTVARGGIKFKQAPDSGSHSSKGTSTHYEGTCISMETFANFLSHRKSELPADVPVFDMTGLKGCYDLKLDWVPEVRADAAEAAAVQTAPPLTVAIQEQLGLKLESRKSPVKIIVVDRINKTPTEN